MGYPGDLLSYYKMLGFANPSSFASFLDSRHEDKKKPNFINSFEFDTTKVRELSKLLFDYIPNYNSLLDMNYYLPIYNLHKNRNQLPNYGVLRNREFDRYHNELKALLAKYKVTRYDFFLAMTSRVGLNPYTDKDIKAVLKVLEDYPKGYHLIDGSYFKNKGAVNEYLGLSRNSANNLWETIGIEHFEACNKLPKFKIGDVGFSTVVGALSYLLDNGILMSEKDFKEGRNQMEVLVDRLKIKVPQNYFVDTYASLFILYLLNGGKE